jgi:hypothetical protein
MCELCPCIIDRFNAVQFQCGVLTMAYQFKRLNNPITSLKLAAKTEGSTSKIEGRGPHTRFAVALEEERVSACKHHSSALGLGRTRGIGFSPMSSHEDPPAPVHAGLAVVFSFGFTCGGGLQKRSGKGCVPASTPTISKFRQASSNQWKQVNLKVNRDKSIAFVTCIK